MFQPFFQNRIHIYNACLFKHLVKSTFRTYLRVSSRRTWVPFKLLDPNIGWTRKEQVQAHSVYSLFHILINHLRFSQLYAMHIYPQSSNVCLTCYKYPFIHSIHFYFWTPQKSFMRCMFKLFWEEVSVNFKPQICQEISSSEKRCILSFARTSRELNYFCRLFPFDQNDLIQYCVPTPRTSEI